MSSQNCPKCQSNRVRRGYRPTPFWMKILFRYNLLCDNCNWEFVGWAIPGTVSSKPTKNPKKNRIDKIETEVIKLNPNFESNGLISEKAETNETVEISEVGEIKKKAKQKSN